MKIRSTLILTLACISILAGWRMVDAALPAEEKHLADFATHQSDDSAHHERYVAAEARLALAPTLTVLTERLDLLETALIAAEARIDELEKTLAPVRLVEGDLNGLPGPHFIIEGCNVHVRGGGTGLGYLIQGFTSEDFDEL